MNTLLEFMFLALGMMCAGFLIYAMGGCCRCFGWAGSRSAYCKKCKSR